MRKSLAALGAGLLFGLGLTVARMVDPAKVLGFLDIAGDWDPSLAFVLGGAVTTAGLGFRLVGRLRTAPLLVEAFPAPASQAIDGRLLAGAAIFGAGWGLVGICPGPALAGLAIAPARFALFVACMIVGMAGFALVDRFLARSPQAGRA